jgi:thaumarchaeosortase
MDVSMITKTIKKNTGLLKKLLPILALLAPILILYWLDPGSYELMWKGRTFYLFFVWLIFLEIILEWEKVPTDKVGSLRSARTAAFIISLLLPTVYIVVANFYGLNTVIIDLAEANNVSPNVVGFVPLSTEYLVLTVMFVATVLLSYGKSGLRIHSISALFLGIIGAIYTIDNLFPYGKFTPFQIFVPITATLATGVLNLMGYHTSMQEITDPNYGWLLSLRASDPNNPLKNVRFEIAWPCAGVESLLIYTVTIFLFLKSTPIPWKQRIVYFVIGAAVTFFINVLRVVTIFVIGMNTGGLSAQTEQFHNFYGQFYSIIWIVSYPLLIIGSRALWGRITAMRDRTENDFESVTKTA